MTESFKSFTVRLMGLLKRGEPAPEPKKIETKRVIRPEQAIPEHGKQAPKSSTRRLDDIGAPPADKPRMKTERLPGGVTHVKFTRPDDEHPRPKDSVAVRDPVTRRLSRRELRDGMSRDIDFYDEKGDLKGETNTTW